MKSKNEPIVLSGRVYLDGILAQDNIHLALPRVLMVGDIKLHNVNKDGKRQRFGQTITYTGFIVATIYDGKSFRRLLLRKLGAVESTHTGPVARRETASNIVRYLRTLVRRQAEWFADESGYAVTRVVVAQLGAPGAIGAQPAFKEKKTVEAPVATPVDATAKATPAPQAVEKTVAVDGVAAPGVSVTVSVSVKVDCPNRSTASRGRRNRRGKGKDTNQLELFAGEK